MESFYTKSVDCDAIKIIGKRIKKRRKQFQMSQSQLAAGICTQGLISMIENKNLAVSIDIIYQICKRLKLEIHDIIMHGHTNNKTLDQVETAIWNRQYKRAQSLISRVRVNNLDRRELKCRYYCYLGNIHFKLTADYQAAIAHFNEVLLKYSGIERNNFYTTWAHIGIAKAYLMLEDVKQADQFNELSVGYLKLHRFNLKNNFKLLINIYLESIQLHQKLLKHKEAISLSQIACRFLVSIDSMYRLSNLNLAMAQSLIASNAHQKAVHYLNCAHHLANVYDDCYTVKQVQQLRKLVIE